MAVAYDEVVNGKRIQEATVKYTKDLTAEDVEHICESEYHLCAVVVEHPEWGVGKPLIGRHAEPDTDGNVAWYDVEFEHGVEEKVSLKGMTVLDEMSHGSKKKSKKEELDPVGQADDDIDNDGDVDSTDKYLKNRRKAIKKSMKKQDKEEDEMPVTEKQEVKENPTGLKIYYKNNKGQENSAIVFTAKDAAEAEKEIKRRGGKVIARAMMMGKKEGPKKMVESLEGTDVLFELIERAGVAAQTNKATKSETQNDVNTGKHGGGDVRGDGKGAEEFVKTHTTEKNDDDEKAGPESASKAMKAGPGAKARRGDNLNVGDKKMEKANA